jgi:ribosomal protein S27AE
MEVTCPHCGFEIEIWSDEDKTMCGVCGYGVFSHEDITN